MNHTDSNCPVRDIKLSFPRGSNELGCSKQLNTRFLSECQMCSPAIRTSVVQLAKFTFTGCLINKAIWQRRILSRKCRMQDPTSLSLHF
jgi:hypothetical protein